MLQEGDLDSWCKKQGNNYLPEDTIMIIFVQICLGLLHVHKQACSCPHRPLDSQ